jgi:hypothetical protein
MAVLACGSDAVLSHRSAAELWGIGHETERRIDVTIRRRSGLERRGIKAHCRRALPQRSVVDRFGIPVTHPIQTLIDLATELKILRLERAVNEADKLDLVDPETLRVMLDRHTFRLSDSDLEVFFRPLALAAGLPDHGLVVEADGLRYHRTAAQQARIVKRDQKHTAAGFRVLRFTHWQIAHAPEEVADLLRQIAATPSQSRDRDRSS